MTQDSANTSAASRALRLNDQMLYQQLQERGAREFRKVRLFASASLALGFPARVAQGRYRSNTYKVETCRRKERAVG